MAVSRPSQPMEVCPGGCETVLLAEDETAVRQSTREFLSLNGYIVLEAKNGTEAVAIARRYKGPIHLMITDVVMPHMGGAKLAGELAFERPDMKVLFVSGYAENTVLRHGPIDVTTRFLQKPFSLKTLSRKMREVLDRFLRALAEQLRRDGNTDDRPLDRNARIVRPQDLKNMLDRIENLARNGSRDAARRLLDEMQAMLDSLSRGKQARSEVAHKTRIPEDGPPAAMLRLRWGIPAYTISVAAASASRHGSLLLHRIPSPHVEIWSSIIRIYLAMYLESGHRYRGELIDSEKNRYRMRGSVR